MDWGKLSSNQLFYLLYRLCFPIKNEFQETYTYIYIYLYFDMDASVHTYIYIYICLDIDTTFLLIDSQMDLPI